MTITCDDFRLNVDAYDDGVLSPSEQAAFEAHRAACAECRRAVQQARWLGRILRDELQSLAAASPAEQMALRESVLRGLGLPTAQNRPGRRFLRRRWRLWAFRATSAAILLVFVVVAVLTSLPGRDSAVSAAQIVDRAMAAIDRHQGMTGVLHWEGEWSQHFPQGDQITRTFEIWFHFDDPARYRMTKRDPQGQIFDEMVRDGVNRMWQMSRTVLDDGQEHTRVDEIILSAEEMRELSAWYVPSPFLDDLARFSQALDRVEKVAEVEVAGRPAYVLRGQLFGLGRPYAENRIEPVTSTVELVVDAETYWVLGRVERVPLREPDRMTMVGFIQQTQSFAILSPEHVPAGAFDFTPPPEADVRAVQGVAGYFQPSLDLFETEEAANLNSFTLVAPAEMPRDLQPRPVSHRQEAERTGALGIIFLGFPGRHAFLIEYASARLPTDAARMLTVGEKQAWLVPDPIDGKKFDLVLIEYQPAIGLDGRSWPRSLELQAWGMSLDEAIEMLSSLEPYQ